MSYSSIYYFIFELIIGISILAILNLTKHYNSLTKIIKSLLSIFSIDTLYTFISNNLFSYSSGIIHFSTVKS